MLKIKKEVVKPLFELFNEELSIVVQTDLEGTNSFFRYYKYFLEKEGESVYIYQQTRNNKKAWMKKGNCYIDDPRLFSKLKELLPEYTSYFANKTKLL